MVWLCETSTTVRNPLQTNSCDSHVQGDGWSDGWGDNSEFKNLLKNMEVTRGLFIKSISICDI